MRYSPHLFNILSKTTMRPCQISAQSNHQIATRRQLSVLDPKRTHPSADRNQQPIADALRNQVEHTLPMQLLEIASGTGQHQGFLAPLFPNITFQPTEFDPVNFDSIRAYAADCLSKNIREPLFVDICNWEACKQLRPKTYDYMLNCNMIHISSWACTEGLFRAAGQLLKPKGVLFTYGPYAVNGVLAPESNVNFDQSLRGRNPEWGVRDIKDLKRLAAENHMNLKQALDMPSNNKLLTWIKQ